MEIVELEVNSREAQHFATPTSTTTWVHQMSSDAEDYDGDTNWDEIAAIRDTLSPHRPRVQTSAPSGTSSTRSLSLPLEGGGLAVVQGQVQPSGSRGPSARTNRVATTAAPTPAVTRGNHTNDRSGSISRANENNRVQNIICMDSFSSHCIWFCLTILYAHQHCCYLKLLCLSTLTTIRRK
jgi:hypothetical protein